MQEPSRARSDPLCAARGVACLLASLIRTLTHPAAALLRGVGTSLANEPSTRIDLCLCISPTWQRPAGSRHGCGRAGVEHLHAHFGTNSAEVAMLVHDLGGPPWSFTVHGPEEFDKLARRTRRKSPALRISSWRSVSYGRSQLLSPGRAPALAEVHVVHCGLERVFSDVAARPRWRPPVCVGRLCEQKGQLLLVEAARRLARRTAAFELVLAGDGESRDEIEALIKRTV